MKSGEILDSLGSFQRRYRQQRVIAAVARWSLLAGLLSVTTALVLKIASLPLLPGVVVPLFVPVLAALAMLLRPIPMPRVAMEIDRRAALTERVSTAVEWQLAGRGQTLMSQAQQRDALQSLASLTPAQVFPLEVPRSTWSLVPLLLVTVALVLLPAWHFFGARPTPVTVDLTGEADAIEKVARELETRSHDGAVPLPELAHSAQDLQALAREMRAGQMAEREAMARIADARASIEKTLEQVRREQESRAAGDGKSAGDGAHNDGDKAAGDGQKKPGGKDPSKARASGQPGSGQQGTKQAREALEKRAHSLEKASRELEASRSRISGEQAVAAAQSGQRPSAMSGSGMTQEGDANGAQATQNKGQKLSQGKGKGEADFGVGTTNEDQSKHQAIEPKKYVLDRQAAERKQWTVAYQKLYGAERVKREAATARVKGDRTDQGRTVETDEQVRGAPQTGGGSQVDDRDVYADSRRRAEEAMARDTVPDSYRDLVRNYFEEINPGDSKKEP